MRHELRPALPSLQSLHDLGFLPLLDRSRIGGGVVNASDVIGSVMVWVMVWVIVGGIAVFMVVGLALVIAEAWEERR